MSKRCHIAVLFLSLGQPDDDQIRASANAFPTDVHGGPAFPGLSILRQESVKCLSKKRQIAVLFPCRNSGYGGREVASLIALAIREAVPGGAAGIEIGKIVRAVFLCLKRRQRKHNPTIEPRSYFA